MDASARPVVVGIADKQTEALAFAMSEAKRLRTSLRVVHCVGTPLQGRGEYVDAGVYDENRRQGQAVLDEARREVEDHVFAPHVEYVLSSLPPINELEAQSHESVELVLGTDEVHWWERILGDAVTMRLAMRSVAPVVAVPETSYPEGEHRDVIVAVDPETPASGPLGFGFQLAAERDGVLRVLHARPPAHLPGEGEAIEARIGQLLASWHEAYPNVRVELDLVAGQPDETCLKATEHAGLVILGRARHQAPINHAVFTHVLRRARCPVAVVPGGWRVG